MNINTSNNKVTVITLDLIAQMKAEKLKEVQQAKADMVHTLHELFSPSEKETGVDGFMHHLHTGIAVYDGVRTGIKIISKFRSYFHKKKKR